MITEYGCVTGAITYDITELKCSRQKVGILGKYKIKWDFVPLDPPSFIKSWDKVPTFVNILSKYKISWDFVPTDLLVYRNPRHSGGVENSLSDEQNSLMC